MSLELFLLGQPRAVLDGHAVSAVRGTKAWALLAYLLLADGQVERRRLASMLFPDADDPSASLRWNLSQLRRGLGMALEGDPLTVTLPEDTWVDLEVLANGETGEAAAVALRGQELLDGVVVDDLDAFSAWLDGERRHVVALCAAGLREAAALRLAGGDAEGASVLAERVVRLEPFDENAVVLLVRALREAGRLGEAHAVAAATAVRFRRELGTEPSSALWSAAHASTGGAARSGGAAATQAQLEAGEAAIAAGLPDAGIDALREALGGARALSDAGLLARSLTALGSALIHAIRGSDQDGLALLHEAIPLAAARDLPGVAARATRELGYVDMLRGRYGRAQRWFEAAAEHATGDDEELAWIAAFAGAARTDVADHAAAIGLLDEAVGRADASGSLQASAMALAMRGRLRLFLDDPSGAAEDLDRSVAVGRAATWRAFVPWPQTIRAEVAYRDGELDHATALLEAAHATSLQVADPCWESMALRGLGLARTAQGDVDEGLGLLENAPHQCRRLPDTYLWIEAYGLDALADVSSRRGLDTATRWIDQLEELSVRHGMRTLSSNAASYRER
ncbi:MAG: BTAD domain-containing putative transcriptional regulator [Nitriliruptor sp.]|uniref:AfsR/SARP family transcriptional regulator n=1 Tax=Nitriliruptor sp. TaxID=2448056 RepID=UPI00349FD339